MAQQNNYSTSPLKGGRRSDGLQKRAKLRIAQSRREQSEDERKKFDSAIDALLAAFVRQELRERKRE